MMRYIVPPTTNITDACKEAISLAKTIAPNAILFEFNDLQLAAVANTDSEVLENTYHYMTNMRSAFKDVFNGTMFDGRAEHEIEDAEPKFPPVGTEFEDPFDNDDIGTEFEDPFDNDDIGTEFEDPFDNDDTPIMSDDALDLVMEYARDCEDRYAAHCIAALVKQVRG